MPFAASFVQTGSVSSLHNIANDNVIQFYPATSELLHAVGMLFLGSDFLSPLVNMAWLFLALLAGWCLGRRYGVGSISIMATSAVLGTSEMVGSAPGSAYNDIVGLALLLSALAVLAHVDALWYPRSSFQGLWVAALAAGLAIGVKVTFIIPVAALTIGVIALLPVGQRVRRGVVWSLVVVVGGGYWYGRNFFYATNPVPNIHLGLGPLRLPSSPGTTGRTITQFLFDGHDWSAYFLPGLRQALGPAWWALVAITAVGLIGGIIAVLRWRFKAFTMSAPVRGHQVHAPWGRDAGGTMAALLAWVGIANLIGYLVTPQPNLPVSFVYDFRFSLFTFVAGLIALPIALARWRRVSLLVPVYGAVMLGTQFASGIWFGQSTFYHSLGDGLLVGVPAALVGLALIVARRLGFRWLAQTAWLVSIVLVAIAIGYGFTLQNYYLAHWEFAGPYPKTDRWASTVHHARIGISNPLTLHYPLYGSDLTNDVQFIGTEGPRSTHDTIQTCSGWRNAVNSGHFQFVVAGQGYGSNQPSPTMWMRNDPAAKVVSFEVASSIFGYFAITVFAVDGPMSISGCRGA
jgi:hypothetical protein